MKNLFLIGLGVMFSSVFMLGIQNPSPIRQRRKAEQPDPRNEQDCLSQTPLACSLMTPIHATESGCELYSYKYLHRKQEVNPDRAEDPGSLRGNTPVYEDMNDVYIFFESGELSRVMTDNAATNNDLCYVP